MTAHPAIESVAVHESRLADQEARLNRIEDKLDALQNWLLAIFSGTLLTLLYLIVGAVLRISAK